MQVVVDTNFAYSCLDNTSTDDESNECGNILMEIYYSGHVMIISSKISEEWDKHAKEGSGSFDWYTRMIREGRFDPITNEEDTDLRSELKEVIFEIYSKEKANKTWKIVEKDLHLIESANIRHKTIISREKNVRDELRNISKERSNFKNIKKLHTIIWIRPNESNCQENNVVQWLKEIADSWVSHGCKITNLNTKCFHWKLIL